MRKVMLDDNGQVYVFPSTEISSMFLRIDARSISVEVGATTTDRVKALIDYLHPVWEKIVNRIYDKYGRLLKGEQQIKEFINNVLKVFIETVGDEVSKWMLDDLYDRIFSDRFYFEYRKEEFLEDNTIVDVNKEIEDMMTDFIGLGVYLPYVFGIFNMYVAEDYIREHGVEAYLDLMEAKLKQLGEKTGEEEEQIEATPVEATTEKVPPENVKEMIINEARIEPVSAQELAREFGLPLAEVENILRDAGAVYDEYSGKWWIPNSDEEREALNLLVDYAVRKGLNKLGFEEAKRVLEDNGFTPELASAVIFSLASKGLIQLNNGIITLPQVKPENKEKVASEKINELSEGLAEEVAGGKDNYDKVMETLREMAEEFNRTTFEKVCYGMMNKLKEYYPASYDDFRAWLKDVYGTTSCRKLYDILNEEEKIEEVKEEPQEEQQEEQEEEQVGENTENEEAVSGEENKEEVGGVEQAGEEATPTETEKEEGSTE